MESRATAPVTELAGSTGFLRATLDCVAVPVWVVDHEGNVLLANPAALAALGFRDASEIEGRNGHETVHYKHLDGSAFPATECSVLEPSRTGVPVRHEEDWFIRRDGSFMPVSFSSVPIDLPGGRGIVMTFLEMTEQREAEQALRERDAILAQVAQPVWVVDQDGLFRYVNPAALAALGYDDAAELVGRPGHDTVHYKYPDGRPYPAEDCPVTHARLSGDSFQVREDWLVRKDGSILPIAYSTAPFDLPGGHGSVTAFTDIEDQLAAERAERERDIADARAAELRAARRRIIEAADAARARLTRDLHDGAQQQFVSAILSMQMAESASASDPETAARMRRSALDQARAGLDELRDLAAGIHPGILTERGLEAAVRSLAARLPLPVQVDGTLARRLPEAVEASVYFFVSEALTNIVKHAQARQAWVSIDADGDHLVVEVRDDGVGGVRTDTGGVGLVGLADRVAALDGELTVDSAPGRGTAVHADIPLA